MAVGDDPVGQGRATLAKEEGEGGKGFESERKFALTKLEGRGFVTAVPGVSLSGGGRRPVGELQDVAGELMDGFSKRAL